MKYIEVAYAPKCNLTVIHIVTHLYQYFSNILFCQTTEIATSDLRNYCEALDK